MKYAVVTIISMIAIGGYLLLLQDRSGDICVSSKIFPKVGLVHCTDEAELGFVLFQPLSSNVTLLIDTEGNEINTWTTHTGFRGGVVRLLPNGNIIQGSDAGNRLENLTTTGTTGALERFSWDGKLEWRVVISDPQLWLHDDIEVLPNGNILAIAWDVVLY